MRTLRIFNLVLEHKTSSMLCCGVGDIVVTLTMLLSHLVSARGATYLFQRCAFWAGAFANE